MAFDFKGGPPQARPNSTVGTNDNFSSSLESLPRPNRSTSSSAGFKNAPTVRNDSNKFVTTPSNLPALKDRQKLNTRTRTAPSRSAMNRSFAPQIPWRIVIGVLAIVAIAVLCYVFRDAITSFLQQVLSWIIIILIIIVIVRWLIFPRRRR